MRKGFVFAGMFLVVVLLFAQPSKADSVVDYSLTGPGITATFSLPQTFTPSAGSGPYIVTNVAGTLSPFGSSLTSYTIELGLSGYAHFSNYWTFGSSGVPGFSGTTGPYLGIFAPNLFTVNSDGSVSLNAGTWALGDYHLFRGGSTYDYTVTAVDRVSTPEPASLALLGVGSLALVGLRRRKSA